VADPDDAGRHRGLLVLFYVLFTTVGAEWVACGRVLHRLADLSILLISQFWTLANDVYDPRQAKRIFGFIGGGASLGGATGAGLTASGCSRSARKHDPAGGRGDGGVPRDRDRDRAGANSRGTSDAREDREEEGVSGGEALRLLRSSRHLQIISLVIAFGALASNIVDQQVNMAVAEFKGSGNKDAIAAFLGQLIVYLSLIGFVIQVR
jgi:AAA family ATP:ADP antiporter